MQPYPTNPISTYSQPGPSPRRSGPNRGLIIGLVAGVIVLALIGLSIFHYTGPTRTVQGFLNDFFVSSNASDAYHQLCPDTQAKVSMNDIQTTLDGVKAVGTAIDISGVTYSLVDENFFGDAHVRVGGTIAVTINGQRQTTPVTGLNNLVTLHTAGLGWCIETNPTS
jgi:hypothetical protein